MTKKSKLTLFITFVMAALLMLTVGFVLMQPTEKVMASTSVFEMENGASVRLVEGSSGIRFRVKMDETTKEKVLASSDAGMLIFPQAYLTTDVVSAGKFMDKKVQDDDSVDTTKLGLYDYIDVDNGSDNMQVYSATDGMWYANGCITGILSANYDLDFAAIAYYFDGTDYVYASFDADFGRSITQVLSTTYLLNGDTYGEAIDTIYGSWFGTETNPIQINDKEEYDAFVNGIDDVNTYEGKYINIEQNIDLGEGDGTNLPYINANFAGTLTASDGAKMTYKSSVGYVPFADDESILAGGVYQCTIDKIISWNENTSKNMTYLNGSSELTNVSYNAWDTSSYQGGYNGNHVSWQHYGNSFYDFKLRFTMDNVVVEDPGTHVQFWMTTNSIAEDETNVGVKFTTTNALWQYANSNTLMQADTYKSDDSVNYYHTWVKYTVPYSDFVEFASGSNELYLFGKNTNNTNALSNSADLNKRGRIIMGDIEIIKDFSADFTSQVVRYKNGATSSLSQVEVTIDTFSNANEVSTFYRLGTHAAYYYTIDFGTKLDNVSLSDYTHLQVYLGFNKFSTTGSTDCTYSVKGLITMSENVTPTNSGMLVKYLIPIEDLIAAQGDEKTLNATSVNLFYLGGTAKGSVAAGTRPYIYFGDVQFVTVSES